MNRAKILTKIVSLCGVTAILFCGAGFLCLFVVLISDIGFLFPLAWILFAASFLLGVLCITMIQVVHISTLPKMRIYLIVSTSINGALFVLLLLVFCQVKLRHWWLERNIPDGRLRVLSRALFNYTTQNNGLFPNANNWCDELMKNDPNLTKGTFKNPRMRNAECGFAFNENLSQKPIADIPGKVVLLFEASGPWDLSGSQELLELQKEKHKYVKVVFVDSNMANYWFYANGIRAETSYEHYPLQWKP